MISQRSVVCLSCGALGASCGPPCPGRPRIVVFLPGPSPSVPPSGLLASFLALWSDLWPLLVAALSCAFVLWASSGL